MKKRQLIATLACLLVGMAGFAGAYSMEQTNQSQTQQEAEISTTELSQVSGVIEPETDETEGNDSEVSATSADASGNFDDSNTGGDIADSNTGGDVDATATGTDASGEDDAVVSNAYEDIDTDTASTGADAFGTDSAVASNADSDSDAASTSVDADNTDDDAASASVDTADTDSTADGGNEDDATGDDAETVDADAVQFAADLRWPLEAGSVVLDYSMDHMVYFETLEQYQYNPAMIISAEVGDKVYVVAEGMITDISTNEETGLTVTEDLGNGYTAIYGQLENVNFAVGDTVERGHVLGYVAETTKYYSVEGTNLYFAMELDGEPVNPLEYFAD